MNEEKTMTTEDPALAAFREIPRRKRLGILFWEFFKIACYVVGGGFAILVAAEDIFVRKYRWMRENELSDMLAMIQTVPLVFPFFTANMLGLLTPG